MLNLIPAPRGSVHMQEGSVKLPETVTVSLGDFAPWCLEAFAARLDGHVETVENGFITLKKADIAKEGYKLTVTKDGITVEAADESGAVWALTTVTELTAEGEALPIVTIEDAPHYGHRGLSLDCSRHFFTADEVKKVIDQMTRVKLNVLHWHLVDDQGWRIECKTLPLLHETTGTYYTQEEIRSVIEYARVRGMEIIPEIDMPGHTRSMIAAYPHLSCFGEKTELCQFGGIFEKILCPGKDETFEFIEKLLTEVCALFPDDRFHIGGDEAPKTEWKKCPHCKARMEALAERLDIKNALPNLISECSHGMKQKIAVIGALIHEPKLILMDEPFVGLDPIAAHELKEIMAEHCRNGGAIFFSTHVLEVAEKLCDNVAIIKNGKLIAHGTMDSVRGDGSLEQVFLELEDHKD